MIHKATEIFKEPDFTRTELDKIFKCTQGKLIQFNGNPQAPVKLDPIPILIKYARQERFKADLPITIRRFYQILSCERTKHLNQERILFWQQQGLNNRQIAHLFKISLPTLQRILKGENNDNLS